MGQFQGVAGAAKRLQTSCDSAYWTKVRVTMDQIWKDLLTLLKAGRCCFDLEFLEFGSAMGVVSLEILGAVVLGLAMG